MRLLVFQHIACEHPGIFRTLLNNAGIEWSAVELDEGEAIPALEDFDALWVMGGPMDVWDEDTCPWLKPEKAAIRHWVTDLKKPFLGICLGHQLLADALGGRCQRQARPEIGILEVSLTAAAKSDALLVGIPSTFRCLQWHAVAVTELPPDATVLASSDDCQCQAMRVGDNAWGIQFHVELERSTIPDWGAVPAYADALAATLGEEGMADMQRDAQTHWHAFESNARRLFDNFFRIVN